MQGFEMVTDAEFRGFRLETTKKGNRYFLLTFEAPENGTSTQFYFPYESQSSIPPEKLKKGTIYTLFFDYFFNRFDNNMRLSLFDFVEAKNQSQG